MRAVVLGDSLHLDDQFPDPVPAENQISVRVLKAGICETDLQLCHGYMGFRGVLGHEFVGITYDGRFAGQRVVGEINCACGHCDACAKGNGNHCPQRTVIGILNHDGAFADQLLVPESNLHVVPDHVPDDQAVFVEPLAAACRIPEQIDLRSGPFVVVLGDGRLGNLCAQVLQHHGCRVLVVGKHAWKLNLLQALNIETALLDDVSDTQFADIVVDCTGSPSGLPTAVRMVRPRGTIVLKTTVAAEQELHLAPLVIHEISLIGSRCGPFDKALKLLDQQAIQLAPLISAQYPLEDWQAAFARAVQPDALKVLFQISG